jgi:hypothetical protein
MHRTLCLALLLGLGVVGCNDEDPSPLFVDLQYQLRCLDCMPISQDNHVHDIALLDGELGIDAECAVRSEGGERQVSFSLIAINEEHDDLSYSLEVVEARLGDDPGPDCLVQASEGSNSYGGPNFGACTGGDPTDDEPCQVKLELDGDVITGGILCHHVPNRGERSFMRHLVLPFTEDKPAPIEIHGCSGL